MTESEAINRLVDHFRIHNDGRPTPYLDEAVSMAINALKMQIQKKIVRVELRPSEYGSEYRCPICESDLIPTEFFNEDCTEPDEKIAWCSGCGQKLDWSE